MPAPLPVAVVVVTWNSAHEIESCLRSAHSQGPAEIIVVDNGSDDGTVDRVRASFPNVHVIECDENRGFATGCNLGIKASTSDFVLMLNADAHLHPGYLETLVAHLSQNETFASAVGKMISAKGKRITIDSAGIVLNRHALRPMDRGYGETDRGQYDKPEDIFGPSGAAALYRRRALDELGSEPFDEDLFAYYEDVDLAWRLNNRGWSHAYVPSAVVEHSRRGPDDKPKVIAARAYTNRYLVWLKNESAWRFLSYGWLAGAWEAARVVRYAARGSNRLSGFRQAARLIPRMLRKRAVERRAMRGE